jgi:hypothetical protein
MIDIVSEVGTAPARARPRPLPYDVIVDSDILVAVPSHIVFYLVQSLFL